MTAGHMFKGASGRRWFTEPSTLKQVGFTKSLAEEAHKKLNNAISLLRADGVSQKQIDDLKKEVNEAIRKAEIAAVTAREYDYAEQHKDDAVEETQESPINLNQLRDHKIVVKSKTTIKFKAVKTDG